MMSNFDELKDLGLWEAEQIGPSPGRCDPVYGCPPPTEIDCIIVDKVFESCRRTLVDEPSTTLFGVVDAITEVVCTGATVIGTPTCTILAGRRIRVDFTYQYTFRWVDAAGTHTFTSAPIPIEVTTRLPRIGDAGLLPHCEVFLDCLECFVSDTTTVTCCIGIMVVFKLISRVQLMVPTYGYCPQPSECEVTGICPSFTPTWPPYPVQSR
jgi:hypothetical protein